MTITVRCDDDLVDLLDHAADEYDLSRSELIRNILWDAVEDDADVFDALPLEAKRSIWQREARPKQHQAWFRSNIKSRLYDCYNSGLTVEEMKLDMTGRIEEAKEYDRTDWLKGAFEAYADAVESGNFSELQQYFNRDPDTDDADEEPLGPVVRAETWACSECVAKYTSNEPGVLQSKPRTCNRCGNDRFNAEGEVVRAAEADGYEVSDDTDGGH